MGNKNNSDKFHEIPVIMDDQTWIWSLCQAALEQAVLPFVRLPSEAPIRQSWQRLRHAQRMLVHWEAKTRQGGAVIEEVLSVAPHFEVGERVIVLTTNPTHEDVVYFSELGIRRIIKVRNRDKDLGRAKEELVQHLKAPPSTSKSEVAWRKLLYAVDNLPAPAPEGGVQKIETAIERLKPQEVSARYLDALASLAYLKGQDEEAVRLWHSALDSNPNYYRTYNNLIKYYRSRQRFKEALALMQKMQELNKSNISRLVQMGEIQMEMSDAERAEFYFKSALDRDAHCSEALNGLAEIRFVQGDLEESRRLLARSHLAYKAASALNKTGIDMVKKRQYEQALSHYTKAQYVLPQQDKGPLLFYNIGLCYSRWGKFDMAREFLRVALIKEPNYRKAKKLLEKVEGELGEPAGVSGAA